MTFNELYLEYHKQMPYVARQILRNDQDAEDAVQNALEKLCRQLSSMPTEPPQVVRTYVLTAAKHAALDLKRSHRETEDVDEVLLVSRDDLFDEISASEDYARLLRTIDALPLLYREVLMLRYVQERSVAQIAALTGRTRATVRKQLACGKSLLQKNYLKEDA